MNLHQLLQRQLDKTQLSQDKLPDSQHQWELFLSYINKSYLDDDQERYLTEHSIQISSRELIEINEQLEFAQYLAELCYWNYSFNNHSLIWSKGIHNLLHLDFLTPTPSTKEFLKLIHPDDVSQLKANMKQSFLKKTNCELEIRVQTKNERYEWFQIIIKYDDKQKKFSGIIHNINTIKESENKIKELNRALLSTARLAGMSEVATTILHNIGNILNSAYVSVNVLKEHLNLVNYERFNKILEMMQEHSTNLQEYLTADPKGKLILPYLGAIGNNLEKLALTNNEELIRLEKNLNHIKEIVAMQNAISGVPGVIEKVSVSELLDNALEMISFNSSMIKLSKKIKADSDVIMTDRSKMLQIITNLLRNAKQAILENKSQNQNKINITVNKIADFIQISIKDNGIGVPSKNLKKIFSFGFTTKHDGHGFGLHSSALSAKELGGSLNVCSKGIGKGAEFTLILPYTSQKKEFREKT